MKAVAGLALLTLVVVALSSSVYGGLPQWPKDFRWSSAGVPNGYNCIQIYEAAEPRSHTWRDNYFCWKRERTGPGMRWSSGGRINGMRCTQILERSDPHTWRDNYLCVPFNSPLRFSWSSGGAIAGRKCIQWYEKSDPHTWHDNFLCATATQPLRQAMFPVDFRWSSGGVPGGYDCIRITEAAEPMKHTWSDNFFCWKHGTKNPGMRWNSAGPIKGMQCTQILERSDPHTWRDNYLCVPFNSPLRFSWSSGGAIAGRTCIQWYEASDPHTWNDNFLCAPDRANRKAVFPVDFRWSSAGVPRDYDCIQIKEGAEPRKHTWNDNFFCWKHGTKNPGMRWNSAGPIGGMRCTQIQENSDPHTWQDNYLCIPPASNLRFIWSSAGAIKDHSCIQWQETRDPHTWSDNFLCFEKCQLTKIKVLHPNRLQPMYKGTQVIGIMAAGGCIGSHKNTITLSQVDSVEESVGIEITNSREVNWGLSASVEVETSAGFLGSGVSVTVGYETSVGGSVSYSHAESKFMTSSGSSGVAHSAEYTNPGAGLMIGEVARFTFDSSNVPTEMHYKCPSGGTFKKGSSIRLKSTTYQAATFESMSGKFTKKACQANNSLANCVTAITRYESFFGNTEVIRKKFQDCFKGVGETRKK